MLLQQSSLGVLAGFLLIAVLSTLLANTAAYFVLGDEAELRQAVPPGVAMALVGLSAAVLPTAGVIAIALVVDFVVVRLAYGLDRRGTAMITAMHYALTVLAAIGIQQILAIYQTAPG
ncbi:MULTISPECIES: DUF7473 family protein [Halobaculum]|uniref:Uncharacterized protein n=2 Tax=Halobaculum TaxID=43927 RepID=A0A8T8W9F7_9EURY|nr:MULTISPECIES: hypothetical protein [Halobaculum]QZP36479.1 hypothetical protein K6T50_09080 [Halobaculum magnesiiphilum]QZY01453.1 hypothetical protein K6T36_08850 [Halobaculum roseum]